MSVIPFDPVSNKLKVGLEIHQQLGTGAKLFCACPTKKSEDLPFSFDRRLRPTQSELGYFDAAALFEFKKERVNRYSWHPESSCMVEADEEPPHLMNAEALETVMLVAETLRSTLVDEVHVMRKIVIDGSNTSGFQRTAVVALGGDLPYDDKRSVGVQTITIEEDASRILGEDEKVRRFALDRLGVPLVEIALDPIVGNPEEVEKVALSLGRTLRSTGRVARGLGTIRQDLNVSLLGGAVVEVKGVQKLNLIAKVVRYEAVRQMGLVKLSEEIKKRGLSIVESSSSDVTRQLERSGSAVIRRIVERGGVVWCVAAGGLGGLLGHEPFPGVRLGKELAEIARSNGLGGIIHSDEFKKQGISDEEASSILSSLKADGRTGLILVAGEKQRVEVVVALVRDRLRKAATGVPSETRAATEDGETRYLRPRPGAARMYPETDIPDIVMTEERKRTIRASIPPPWQQRVQEYVSKYSLSRESALLLFDSESPALFEQIARQVKLEPSVIASILFELPTRLSREGLNEEQLVRFLPDVIKAVDSGTFAKEAAIDVLRLLGKGEAKSVDEAVLRLGIAGMSDEELARIIQQVVAANASVVAEKGERAFSILMGEVMKVARGRVDGGKVSAMLKRAMNSK